MGHAGRDGKGGFVSVVNRYIIREVLKGSFASLIVLLALFNFFTFTNELKDLGKGDYELLQIFQYLALTSPRVAYELVPFAALLGSLLVLGAMANNREIVAMRAAGISMFRIIFAVIMAGFVLVLFSLLMGEFIAPPSERNAQMIKMTAQSQQVTLNTRYGFWVRDGNMFVNIRRIYDGKNLDDIGIYEFDPQYRLRMVTHADKASFTGDGWELQGIRRSELATDKVTSEPSERALWKSALDPELLNIVVVKPDNLSVYDLAMYVQFLKANNQKSQAYQLAFWQRLVNPLVTFVMLLVSVPFVLGVHRAVSLGQRVVIGAVVGMGFNLFDTIFGNLGLVYDLNPLFAASFPATIVFAAAVAAIARLH